MRLTQTGKRLTQRGFIIFGNGLNRQTAIEQARQQGYYVRVSKTHATLWQVVK